MDEKKQPKQSPENLFEPKITLTPGTLYLVPTPIGNKADFSYRALEILKNVDVIYAEDTRVTALLLSQVQLQNKLISYHEHNKKQREQQIITALETGKILALVSDAGMPCISDPGAELIRVCIEKELKICALPGPNAALTALVVSGLDTRYFTFEGFLPTQGKARQERIQQVQVEEKTLILYEAPHRLGKTLGDLHAAGLEQRKLCLARELTKKYEEILYVTVEEAFHLFKQEKARGEFVLVMEGLAAFNERCPQEQDKKEAEAVAAIERKLAEGSPLKKVVQEVAEQSGLNKNKLYAEGLKIKKQQE